MTDKQIIDGERMFKCVWCKYDFKESDANFILSENPNECVCSGCMTEWADNLLWDFKRKEQECEELKEERNEYFELMAIRTEVLAKIANKLGMNTGIIENKELFCKIDQLKAENEILKEKLVISSNSDKKTLKIIQTLTEIKEIMKKHCRKCKKHKFYYFQLCCTCKYTEILQKISEVQDAN